MQNSSTSLDWEDLRYFAAVCDGGSVAAAARTLAVNHSTVLRRLDSLERTLGVRLFERFQTGYVMTPAGDTLRERMGPLAEQVAAAQRAVEGRDTALSGDIRITTTDTLARSMLLPALACFRRLHPDVRLHLVVNNAFLNLNRREADVALRPSNTPPDTLVGKRLGAMHSAIFGAPGYLKAARGRGIAPDNWAEHDWVGLDDSLAHLAQARWLAGNVPDHRIALRTDSLLTMVDAVREGVGLAPLLVHLAGNDRNLRQLTPHDPAFDTGLWLLTHRDLKDTARIRALMDFLYDELRKFFESEVH
ncbi:LysR family transcriptional regulator [Pseudoduganella ginsengisoli]|uniref:LysR family transcriptional regulator n=1 Tax=Pseudoduganella ginsengisoli TaxID=1462440 RepID=A0A6L6PX93_9BURK|nr:LysR family transcriptional regulator [Pseudoduganella ginsengisoli]MTW01322.1 LysR family transcriptional regulator [Pseudoduganella ginsengisoli]